MKKIFAILMALSMAVCALSLTVFADEFVAFDNADGEAFSDCVNPWDFYGIGGYWGREAANVLTLSVDEIKGIIAEGGATYSYVFSGTLTDTPRVCFDFDDHGNGEVNAFCTVTDLGDGKQEATVALDDLVAAWTAAGLSLDDANNFLVQVWASDFKLYSAKFATGDSAAPTTTPAPAADPEPTATPETTADPEPTTTTTTPEAPKTGLALAVVPAVMALAAVAVSKKH